MVRLVWDNWVSLSSNVSKLDQHSILYMRVFAHVHVCANKPDGMFPFWLKLAPIAQGVCLKRVSVLGRSCMCRALCCCRRRAVLQPRFTTVPRWRGLLLRALRRSAPLWQGLFVRVLRLRFKQRCWAYLGHHLQLVGTSVFRSRLTKLFAFQH